MLADAKCVGRLAAFCQHLLAICKVVQDARRGLVAVVGIFRQQFHDDVREDAQRGGLRTCLPR